MFPSGIQKLIDLFRDLPGIGPRQATRFVFHLLKKPQVDLDMLSEAIKTIKRQFHHCPRCFIVTDNSDELCPICRNHQREEEKMCIVEKDSDVKNIEEAKVYNGLYFILGSADTTGDMPRKGIINLLNRIKTDDKIQEIIIATNPTPVGDATALYVERNLKPLNVKIKRLARGLPSGGEIEYADEITLIHAFKNRE